MYPRISWELGRAEYTLGTTDIGDKLEDSYCYWHKAYRLITSVSINPRKKVWIIET
jgi:hypothetical protein